MFFSQDLKTFRRDASGGRDGVLTLFAVWAQLGATAGLHRVLVEEIERHPGRKWFLRVTALVDLNGQVPLSKISQLWAKHLMEMK